MTGVAFGRDRVRAVLDALAGGLNPMQAARACGVSKSYAYLLASQSRRRVIDLKA